MSTLATGMIATLTMTGLALAQPKVDPGVDAKAGAKTDMSKPPAELAAYAKATVGNWKCMGTDTGADGSTGKITGTVKTRVELDRWWEVDVIDAKGSHGAFKMIAYTTYDPSTRKWRRIAVTNGGGQMIGSSDGPKDNKVDWTMDITSPMGAGQFRDHVDMSDPKSGVKMWGEMSMDKGKTWQRAYEWVCKK